MTTTLELGGIVVEVVKKDIKNVHLSVYPPVGRVRISAPFRMSTDTIRVFAISKLRWIKRQQTKLRQQERETPREYLNRESHYLWGRRYLLKVIEKKETPRITLKPGQIVLQVRPGSRAGTRRAFFEAWSRSVLREKALLMVPEIESLLGVKMKKLIVCSMKTRWGSCGEKNRVIRLNTELVKKPVACLEYVLLHELIHLSERGHGPRFLRKLEKIMPDWKFRKDTLNMLPVRSECWLL